MPFLSSIVLAAAVYTQVETGAKFDVFLRCDGTLNHIETRGDEWAVGDGGRLLYRLKVAGHDDPDKAVYKIIGVGPTRRLQGASAEGTVEASSGKIELHFNDQFLQGFYAATCKFTYVRAPTISSDEFVDAREQMTGPLQNP